jgi:hypothetical protein
MKYICEHCNYECERKDTYNRHLKSKKHQNNSLNLAKQYQCLPCNYKTYDQSNFNRHCLSEKHRQGATTKKLYFAKIKGREHRIKRIKNNPLAFSPEERTEEFIKEYEKETQEMWKQYANFENKITTQVEYVSKNT